MVGDVDPPSPRASDRAVVLTAVKDTPAVTLRAILDGAPALLSSSRDEGMGSAGDRGRNGDCSPPPAQIRTGPIKAYGSYLEYLTANRALGQGWRMRGTGVGQPLHSFRSEAIFLAAPPKHAEPVVDHTGRLDTRDYRAQPCCLPVFGRRQHPGLFSFRGSMTWPMRSPVNASPVPSRPPAHDSGSMWFAIPSSWWTFTSYFLPVSRRTRTKE
jgi:hypothetical protein